MQETPDKIAKLVEYYETLTSGRVPDSFDEAQLKQSFINPFFEELGWNVRNPSEVSVEKRVHIRESTKSADYCFLLNNKPQFIVETKNINKKLTNSDYIFQTKLYGYNLPAPLGVLTNFGRFRLYDTGLEPDYDNPARGLIKKYDLSYADYLDRWDDIYEMFSRSAVEGGSLVELIPKSRRVRNKEALDVKFFESLTEWREDFAKVIALRNPHLNDEYLINEAVQRILDRMVFIRVIEDRGIESVQLLRDALNRWSDEKEKPLYQYVVDKFRYLDPHYNGQLFEKHPLSENLIIDDDLVRQFIESLYYPKSPYQFNKIGVEMLGTIYERFLGSTIRLTPAHRAKVEKKPEVRKARGVYYTPKYIVDYIVENTVGELLKKCKTPRAVANLKILDPACGSGSFLLGAFQTLIDWHEDYYNENPDKIRKGIGPALAGCWYDKETERWKLTAKEKGKILVNNIHGVDIDPSAVEVTIMSLYLKVLEDTNVEFLIKTALLPPLHRNVKCGNSLIGSDYWDFVRDKQGELFERTLSEERRVNTFDWEDEFEGIMKPRPAYGGGGGGPAPQHAGPAPQHAGFDAVIGNPPYVNIFNIESRTRNYLKKKYKIYKNKSDLYSFFIELIVNDLLKPYGYLGYIISSTWLTTVSFDKLRKLLLEKTSIYELVPMPLGTFKEATVETIILVLNRKKRKGNVISVKSLDENGVAEEENNISQERIGEIERNMFILELDEKLDKVLSKIEMHNKLGDLIKFTRAVKTSNDNKFVLNEKKNDDCYKLLRGRDIERYYFNYKGLWIWYRPDLMKEKVGCLTHTKSLFLVNEKIILQGRSGRNIIAGYDNEQFFALDTCYVSKNVPDDINVKYITGILNSKMINFWYGFYYRTATVSTYEIHSIPIRSIDFTNPDDVKLHDRMVGLVEEMLTLHERLAGVKSDADRTRLERAIKKTDKKIDALVYELYGLTEEEIRVVEGVD